MSARNIITNILGAIMAGYGASEVAAGKMTVGKALTTTTTAIVAFATGSKDSQIKALMSRLSPDDAAAVHGIGKTVLDQAAKRLGYRVVLDVPPQNNAPVLQPSALLESIAQDMGNGIGTEEDVRAQARVAAAEARRRLYPQIDGAGISAPEYVARTKAAMGAQTGDILGTEEW